LACAAYRKRCERATANDGQQDKRRRCSTIEERNETARERACTDETGVEP
jgi:hypothetical protein